MFLSNPFGGFIDGSLELPWRGSSQIFIWECTSSAKHSSNFGCQLVILVLLYKKVSFYYHFAGYACPEYKGTN